MSAFIWILSGFVIYGGLMFVYQMGKIAGRRERIPSMFELITGKKPSEDEEKNK